MVDWEDNNTTVVDCPMKDGKDRDWEEDERKKTAVGNAVAERKRSVVAMGDGR
jgi:hypothetical protein